MSNEMVTREIVKCVGLSAPGPHAIVLVVRIGRFTQEESATVNYLISTFGSEMMRYLIVLFTGKDDMDYEGKNLGDLLRNVPRDLDNVLQGCNNRAIAFNNRANPLERDRQIEELIRMIDEMINSNGGRFYTNTVFQEAEQAMIRREEEIQRDEEEKYENQRKEFAIRAHNYDAEEQKLRNELRDLHHRGQDGSLQPSLHDEQHLQDKVDSLQKQLTGIVDKRESDKKDLEKRSRNKKYDRRRVREVVRDQVQGGHEKTVNHLFTSIKSLAMIAVDKTLKVLEGFFKV